jgi:hypothetical protein
VNIATYILLSYRIVGAGGGCMGGRQPGAPAPRFKPRSDAPVEPVVEAPKEEPVVDRKKGFKKHDNKI